MSKSIVPDYIIYDELKRQREQIRKEERPVLHMPKYIPVWPEGAAEAPRHGEDHSDTEKERGEVVIQMW